MDHKQLFKELHKPARRNFPRAPVMVKGIDDTWAIDLVDMGFHNNEKVIQENQGLKYMLTCIDVLSKYAWAVPMKTKDADTVLAAIKHIIKESGRHPKKIYCDEGSEFKGVFRDYFRPPEVRLGKPPRINILAPILKHAGINPRLPSRP